MTVRLLLVRHGTTTAVRAAAFPLDEPLDARGEAELRALAPELPRDPDVRRSPSARCGASAALLGHPDARVEAPLGEVGFGRWAGRTLAEVHGEDAEAAVAWMTDPAFAPPGGGESLEALVARVGGWLDALAADEPGRPVVALTHGGVVRAAVVHALGAPADAAWRIDVAPGSLTELHAHDGRWRLTRLNWTPDRATLRAARGASGGGAAT